MTANTAYIYVQSVFPGVQHVFTCLVFPLHLSPGISQVGNILHGYNTQTRRVPAQENPGCMQTFSRCSYKRQGSISCPALGECSLGCTCHYPEDMPCLTHITLLSCTRSQISHIFIHTSSETWLITGSMLYAGVFCILIFITGKMVL